MLDLFFKPKNVAVVGASREEGKVGYSLVANLLKFGYAGEIFPINPKPGDILGLPSYVSLQTVNRPVDLVVISVPASLVPGVLRECVAVGARAAIIITAGFREAGPEGARLEQAIIDIASSSGIRLLGPNCLGLIDTGSRLNASFAAAMPPAGKIGFFSQSGALCTAILDWAIGNQVGFSKFISLGNKADLSESDFIEYLAEDPDTSVILGYIEGVKDGARFLKAASYAALKKPLIIVKGGGTSAGAKAASSHTGTLAGSEKAFTAAFAKCGVIRAMSVEELFSMALLFAHQPLPGEGGLAIITNAGGPGIMAADATERMGVELASLGRETVEKLRVLLPPSGNFYNPVDTVGDAKADRYGAAIETVLDDPAVGAALILYTPQAVMNPAQAAETVVQSSHAIGRGKPAKPVITSFMGQSSLKPAIDIFNTAGIPNYPFPETGIAAYRKMLDYSRWRSRPTDSSTSYQGNRDAVTGIFSESRNGGRYEIGERDARKVVDSYGFRVPRGGLARTAKEAAALASEVGYPVVMKIASPDILHKSDIGGVKVGLPDAAAVEAAFHEMTANAQRMMPSALIWGVLIQEMVKGGREIILGMSRDGDFGPMIMFGLGGVYVEVLKDVSFRIAPVTRQESLSMIQEIRSYPLLKGVRGERPADIPAIVEAIGRLSQLSLDFPEILEMDINPLLVMPEGEGVVAVDARITLRE